MKLCPHRAPVLIFNEREEPVRLNCDCGREWRVVPIEWDVKIQPEPERPQ